MGDMQIYNISVKLLIDTMICPMTTVYHIAFHNSTEIDITFRQKKTEYKKCNEKLSSQKGG